MAPQAPGIIPLPVLLPDLQLSAFPFAAPDTVIQHLAHELLRLYRLHPVLSANQCLRLLGEISLLAQALDVIESDCKRVEERRARAVGLIGS